MEIKSRLVSIQSRTLPFSRGNVPFSAVTRGQSAPGGQEKRIEQGEMVMVEDRAWYAAPWRSNMNNGACEAFFANKRTYL
jgi:hypothetical protein